jgi:O-antigen/teichoic acid export membrane protein
MALARSIVLARCVGADELGQAVVLAVVLRFAEMMSDFGLERLLVQAPDGDDTHFQANLQGAALLRGLGLAVMLILLAPALAGVFPNGPTVLSYAALASIPLIKGFVHLDYRRAERRFDYRGLCVVDLGATLIMFAGLVAVLAMGVLDHRALIVALFIHAVAQVGLSHLYATRAWQLAFQLSYLTRIWWFGAPLVVNAALMFLTLQAERLIVAGAWGWSDVAIYGVVAQLAFLPAQIFGRAANSLLLPKFSNTTGDAQTENLSEALLHSAGGGAVFALCFLLAAPVGIQIVYGVDFAPAPELALVFGLAAAARIARTPWSVFAVATARTGDTARANVLRAASLIPAIYFALTGHSLVVFAACAACGEAAAWLAGWALFKRHECNEVMV